MVNRKLQISFILILCLFRVSLIGQWNSINSGTSFDLHQIEFSDSLNGYIIGDSSFQTIIVKTSDGAITWKQILKNNQFYAIAFLNQDTGAILGNDTIFRTFDGGTSWIYTEIETPHSFVASPLFHMNTATEWFYIRGSRHAHTTDAGKTWTEISLGLSGPIPIVPTDMQFVNDSTIIGIGWYGPMTFISSDKRNSWDFLGKMNASQVTSCTFINESIRFAATDLKIFKSTDVGVTWNPLSTTRIYLCLCNN